MILTAIEHSLSDLRKSERRVAEYILARPNLISRSSIRLTAEGAGVSEPTVIRFCRAVGCNGFQDLKQKLSRDAGRLTPATIKQTPPGLGPVAALNRRFDLLFAALFKLREAIDLKAYAQAGQILANASKVAIWRLNNEPSFAEAATERLSQIGVATIICPDAPTRCKTLQHSGPETAVLITSSQSNDSLRADLETARAKGMSVVALDPHDADFAQAASVALPMVAGLQTTPSSEATGAILRLFALDLLCTAIAEAERA